MPNERARQKKLAKQKRKRNEARDRARAVTDLARVPAERELIRQAAALPFGPSYVAYGGESEDMPGLVTVLLTRVRPDGSLVPVNALVDRTCLGVKNGYVGSPMSPVEMRTYLEALGDVHARVEPCELLFAQSIIFHAIDYARTLGFSPHRDFPVELLGPRPAVLLETPLAHPAEPLYINGPGDDVGRILKTLAAHGHDAPKVLVHGPGALDELVAGLNDEEDESE